MLFPLLNIRTVLRWVRYLYIRLHLSLIFNVASTTIRFLHFKVSALRARAIHHCEVGINNVTVSQAILDVDERHMNEKFCVPIAYRMHNFGTYAQSAVNRNRYNGNTDVAL